jgi:hypothetical protein
LTGSYLETWLSTLCLFLTVATVPISFQVLQPQGAAISLSPTRTNLFFDSVPNPTMNQDTVLHKSIISPKSSEPIWQTLFIEIAFLTESQPGNYLPGNAKTN